MNRNVAKMLTETVGLASGGVQPVCKLIYNTSQYIITWSNSLFITFYKQLLHTKKSSTLCSSWPQINIYSI